MPITQHISNDIDKIDSFAGLLEDLSQSAKEVKILLSNVKLELLATKRPYLNSEQASKYLGISINTLRAYCAKNLLPYYKLGKLSYYLISDLDSFVINKTNRVGTVDELRSEAATMSVCNSNSFKKQTKKLIKD